MTTPITRTLVLLLFAAAAAQAQVPQLINYQGRVAVHGVDFDGPGQFKFALVDAAGTISYWSNDGTSTAGSEPALAVAITVTKGQYSVLLGDTTLPNMAAIPADVMNHSGVLLRVWFNDGTNGAQLLTPDQPLATPAPVNARDVRDSPVAAMDCWQERGDPPAGRSSHTAVWTGTEMIVWGGYNGAALNTGGRYDPAGNSWTTTTTTGAPSARRWHTAVWTGSEMIVWGGYDDSGSATNTGGRYNPATNSWTTVTTTGALSPRRYHTAVWTGTEMIVWGGFSTGYSSSGGRYNPASNSWTTVTTIGVPTGRANHTAVWTGSEMIVWGGADASSTPYLNTGGRYNPAGNSWTAVTTTGVPTARRRQTAVWTGTEMIVWGGQVSTIPYFTNTGGRYNPTANSWTALSTTGAPSVRSGHTAVWTGSEMIVWGGVNGGGLTGGRYNPAGNSWTAVNTTGAPSARYDHTAVWTGSEMIVWGGDSSSTPYLNTGGSYNPAGNSWAVDTGAPAGRSSHTAVWTGTEMIVWGGYNGGALNTGGRYNPAGNSWTTSTTTGAPSARRWHTAVWTGSEMIVWGGYDNNSVATNSGGRYNPATNSWTAVTTTGAPSPRRYHTAVWAGTEMIVWGGENLNTGGRYNPATNSWTAVTTTAAPVARYRHTAVWTGTEMIVWGGYDGSSYLNDGSRYHPAGNSWTAVTTTGAPVARGIHTAVWTGSEMIVWGGSTSGPLYFTNTGGRYNPTTNSWTALSTTSAPSARHLHTAVWTGSEMIIWGGSGSGVVDIGGRYNPAGNSWTAVNTTGAPAVRFSHTAVWTGTGMIVWGGDSSSAPYLSTGGSYNPDCGVFRVTGLVLDHGSLILNFPTLTGRSYTLWQSDTLAGGTWTDTGLSSIAGDGANKVFTVAAPVAGTSKRFYRVQAAP